MRITFRAILETATAFGRKLGKVENYLGPRQPYSQCHRRMKAHFGMGPVKLADLWNHMDEHLD